jgi:hypothetical protein
MLKCNKFQNWYVYLYLLGTIFFQSAMGQSTLKISPPVRIYEGENTYARALTVPPTPPATVSTFQACDAVTATQRDADNFYVYRSTNFFTFKFFGTPGNPEQSQVSIFPKQNSDMFRIPPGAPSGFTFDGRIAAVPPSGTHPMMVVALYLKNIFQMNAIDPTYNSNELLGFVHLEYMDGIVDPMNPTKIHMDHYSIGICYSGDGGTTWTFCGEIIRPMTARCVGGCAYIIVKDNFYLYFNEQVPGAGDFPSVAQAPVKGVCAAAKAVYTAAQAGTFSSPNYSTSTNSLWYKFTGFDATGKPQWASSPNNAMTTTVGGGNLTTLGDVDMHSDAVYCSSLKKFLIAVTTRGLRDTRPTGDLYIYQSDDGINWSNPKMVKGHFLDANNVNREMRYPFFLSVKKGATSDCREVGEKFYIYFLAKDRNAPVGVWKPTDLELWRAEVGYHTISPIHTMLLETSN